MKILADTTLPLLHVYFPPPFTVSVYHNEQELYEKRMHHEILICRSTLKLTPQMLQHTPIQCVATASSGIDHLEQSMLYYPSITFFDAKGCNAIAVTDYITSCLAFLDKNAFIKRPTAAVIGVGEVGSRVAHRLKIMGFGVQLYDPPKAIRSLAFKSATIEDVLHCDLICVHANLHEEYPYQTRSLLSTAFFDHLQPGTVIINAARGGIVDEIALLNTKKPFVYCTDVYQNEPSISPLIINKAVLCTPHIAGHSIEAKANAVALLSIKLHHHYGLPPPSMPPFYKNIPFSWPNQYWQDCMLALYNPLLDTQCLKKATNKKRAFLLQRLAHDYRHDFHCYNADLLPKHVRELLGQESRV